jgi:hypothetical protein
MELMLGLHGEDSIGVVLLPTTIFLGLFSRFLNVLRRCAERERESESERITDYLVLEQLTLGLCLMRWFTPLAKGDQGELLKIAPHSLSGRMHEFRTDFQLLISSRQKL